MAGKTSPHTGTYDIGAFREWARTQTDIKATGRPSQAAIVRFKEHLAEQEKKKQPA